MRSVFLGCLALLGCLSCLAGQIRVLVWDEQQPEQLSAYTNYLGNQIATYLRTFPEFDVRSARLADPEQGLTVQNLDFAQVLIWWGHVKNREVDHAKAEDIVNRIKDGRLSFIALHSAHWSEPFVVAMRERTKEDAIQLLALGELATAKFEFVIPERFAAPKADAPLTPGFLLTNAADGSKHVTVTFPNCCFPAFRTDGAVSHVFTRLPRHPIARGIPAKFDISHTEMYNEPFHVPRPDAVIFEEHWDRGEWFRSGCLWNLGKGRVFYFRPGHETYAVYREDFPLKIISNAVEWLGTTSH